MENNDKNYVKYYSHPLNWILSAFAIIVSWFFNHSVLWAIFHGIFAGVYLVYCTLLGRFADGKLMEIIHHYF